MAKEIDVRGLSCPLPVMLVKKAIDAGEVEIKVITNDSAAVSNVQRLGKNRGFRVEVDKDDDNIILLLKR